MLTVFKVKGQSRSSDTSTSPKALPESTTVANHPPRSGIQSTEAQSSQQMSSNYYGSLRRLDTIPEEVTEAENTSVFVTNLPPDCTVTDVLSRMHGIGKIWACNTCAPTEEYLTSAMKIVFWDRAGRERLIALSKTGTFYVGSYHPEVRLNRFRTASRPWSQVSRVVGISGPTGIVNLAYLEELFSSFGFFWEADYFVVVSEVGDIRVAEYAFASYLAQAETAMNGLKKHISAGHGSPGEDAYWARVNVYWGRDPCEER